MSIVKTFNFSPISNERQQIHTISFSERISKGKESVMRPHRTNFYILVFITHGFSQHLVDFQTYNIKEGDFFIIRPGQIHAFLPTNDCDGTIIAFTEDFLLHKSHYHFLSENSKLLGELSFSFLFHLADDKREKVYQLMHMIQQELANSYDALQENILQSHLSSLLLCLIRLKRGDNQSTPNYSKDFLYALQFKNLIEKSWGKQYTVTQYAQEIGISTRSLQKISEAHFGKSPKAMIQYCVLLESKRMLIDQSLQVKEIAYNLGFDEPTNFTKFFKKFTKISPEQFRKLLS